MAERPISLVPKNGNDTVALVPKDGSAGRVLIELPMSAELAGEVMRACSALGFELEHIVRRSQANA
jgi:hypothetical protein